MVDRFELIQRAGAGGMGEVWRARDRVTGQEVALKLLLGSDPLLQARFAREAEGLARVVAPARASAPRSGLITPDLEARLGSGELLRAACETLEISSDRGIAEGDLRRASLSLYLGTSHHPSADFVLLHGVTAVDAVAALLPFAGPGADLLLSAMATALTALRIAYVPEVSPLHGSRGALEPELVRAAIASGDDHAIKLAGACTSGQAFAPELPWGRALAKALRQ